MADEVALRLRALHDQLVEAISEGSGHDVSACAQCTPIPQEGASVTTTYTEDEVTTRVSRAVDDAVGEMRTQLADLRASQEAAQIEERVATAVEAAAAPLRTQVSELQTQLDAAVLEAAAATARVGELETAAAEAVRLGEIASRRDARLAAVREAAPGFDEAYLTANADRWAGMEDAEFATYIAETRVVYEAAKATAGTPAPKGLPTTSALQATTMDKGAGGGAPKQSAVSALATLRRSGVDVRTF